MFRAGCFLHVQRGVKGQYCRTYIDSARGRRKNAHCVPKTPERNGRYENLAHVRRP
jgi:hypothetical protein